jgi:hypothetical protein
MSVTTVDPQKFKPSRDSHGDGAGQGGGEVVGDQHRVGRSRLQRALPRNLLCRRGKENLRDGGAGPPAHPSDDDPTPVRPGSARARGEAYRVWEGREGAVGAVAFKNGWRASDDLRETGGRVNPEWRWRRHTRWARTQGTKIAETQLQETLRTKLIST